MSTININVRKAVNLIVPQLHHHPYGQGDSNMMLKIARSMSDTGSWLYFTSIENHGSLRAPAHGAWGLKPMTGKVYGNSFENQEDFVLSLPPRNMSSDHRSSAFSNYWQQ